MREEREDDPMQPTTAPSLDFTNSEVDLLPNAYAWDEDELDEVFDTYVKLGNEVIGRYRGITATVYTKV